MTRNVKYVCAMDGEFWSAYSPANSITPGKAPPTARCPTCKIECPRLHPPRAA